MVEEAVGPALHGVVVVRRRVEVMGHVVNVVRGEDTFVGEAAVEFLDGGGVMLPDAVGVFCLDAGGDEADEEEGKEGEESGGGEEMHFC